jgi:hypothetical protein
VIDTCCNFFFVPSLRDPDGPLLILTAKLWKHGCMIWRPAAYKVQNETKSNDYTNPALKLVLFTKKKRPGLRWATFLFRQDSNHQAQISSPASP